MKGRKAYDYRHHGRPATRHVEFVPDDIVDRFCLLGPAEQHVERLGELAGLGVDQFALYLMHDSADATFEAYRDSVIPAVQPF